MRDLTGFGTGSPTRWLPSFDYRRLLASVLIVGFFAFFLAPIWTGLVTSLKTGAAVTATTPFVPPTGEQVTLRQWSRALAHLQHGFVNSLLMAIPATFFSVLLGSTAAYGLTILDWQRKLPVLVAFLVGIFVPLQAVLVPLSEFWSSVVPLEDLLAPVWSLPLLAPHHAALLELTVTHVAYGIPICLLMFRSYYNTISPALVDAARIDGASITAIYYRIVLPLSKPMFGVVAIYQFTQIWNEFLFSLTLIGSSASPAATITLVLSGIGADMSGINFGLRMAGALLAAMPTVIVYVLFAEQFAKGLSTG